MFVSSLSCPHFRSSFHLLSLLTQDWRFAFPMRSQFYCYFCVDFFSGVIRDSAFGNGSGYGGGRRCPGGYCDSPRGVKLVKGHLRTFSLPAVAVAAALLIAGGSAQGQAPSGYSGGVISLGGRGWSSFEAVPVTSDQGANQLEFSFRGGFATDYMYRGTTLSDHKPAVGAAVEATFAQLYAGVAVASVSCQPSRLLKSR